MRTSPDFYKDDLEGRIFAVWQNQEPPKNTRLIFGYDYKNQKWVLNGREEVETAIKAKKCYNIFWHVVGS